MLSCLNELHHVILDVLTDPWRENNIFGFFGVCHANWGKIKFGINTKRIEYVGIVEEVEVEMDT